MKLPPIVKEFVSVRAEVMLATAPPLTAMEFEPSADELPIPSTPCVRVTPPVNVFADLRCVTESVAVFTIRASVPGVLLPLLLIALVNTTPPVPLPWMVSVTRPLRLLPGSKVSRKFTADEELLVIAKLPAIRTRGRWAVAPYVTAPAPAFTVIPPVPIVRFTVVELVPLLERMNVVAPVDLKVCD